MEKIRNFFSLNQASVFLIALPYFALNYNRIINSPFFSLKILSLLIIILLFVSFFTNLITNKERGKYTITSLIIYFLSFLFFYGTYIVNFIQKILSKYFHFVGHGKVIIIFLTILYLLSLCIFKKRIINFIYLNVFLIIMCFVSLIFSISNFTNNQKKEINNNFIAFENNIDKPKPIILIITDEYSSPDEIYKVNKDTGVYEFSKGLTEKGWTTKNRIYSYETSTIHSLSSLFNFNLSKSNKYKDKDIVEIGALKLINASLADSLRKKNVSIINFGIFHLGNQIYLNRLYPYPISLIDDVFINTSFYAIKTNIGKLDSEGLANSSTSTQLHNKYIFDNLHDTINKNSNLKLFTYVHLIMPHIPFQFYANFPLKKQNNLSNYTEYWDFTNKKIDLLLDKLIKENKFRIILTGDHGYRSDKRINPNYTFSAFYGFNQESINRINSIQDLGSLIYGYY
jgi:hypothetical protein